MARKGPDSEPNVNLPDVTGEAREKWQDFYDSSEETQKVLKDKAQEEFWDLYETAHDVAREDALAGVRTRLHRLEQRGVEVTPEMEQREIEEAEKSFKGEVRPRGEKGRFKKGKVEKFERAVPKDMDPKEVRRIMETAGKEIEYTEQYENASDRTARKIERARVREEFEIAALAEQLRREDALTNVENHIKNTSEQGARWWPWDKALARRRALRDLKGEAPSDSWLAYAEKKYHEQQDAYIQNGESLSESRRALSASGDRIKSTWKNSGRLKRFVTMPARLAVEGARLLWQGGKRGRKEARTRLHLRDQKKAEQRAAESESGDTES